MTDHHAGSDAGVRGYILAGGRSRRFGSDKARAVRDGAPVITGVARAIAPFVSSVTVVAARDGQYDDLGLRTIGDRVGGRGPMDGLLTALDDLGGDGWLLLAACDWVGIRSSWVAGLLDAERGGKDAVAFRSDRFEPLLALYHARLLHRVKAAAAGADRSLQSLLARANTRVLPAPGDWHRATNMNTNDDHEAKN